MKRIALIILLCLFGTAYGQTTIGYFRYDTAKFYTTKVGGRGSLDVTGNVRFTGLLPMVGATDSVVVRDVNGNLGTTAKGAFGATIPISSLLAATATNSINNANFGQTWSWDDLDGTGLFVFANATEADNNNQILFGATLLGANANASQTTATAAFSNVHTGTSSTNIALALTASGGSTNIGLQVGRGSTNLGTVGTENGVLKFNGLTSGTVTVQPQDAAGTWTFKWPTTDGAPNEFLQTDGNGVATWAAPSGGGLTVGTTTITSGTDTRVLYNNAGVLGEYVTTGTGDVVRQTSPTIGNYTLSGVGTAGVASITNENYDLLIGNAIATAKFRFLPLGDDIYFDNTDGGDMFFRSGISPAASTLVTITGAGRVFVGGATAPTAFLHVAAGQAAASTAGIKQTSGTLNTTPEIGTMEYNNAHYQTNNALNRYATGGAIKDFIATVDNVGTGETDLFTYTTKASTLAADGEKLTFNIGGTFNDITATAQLQFYFAGTSVGNTGALTVSATGGWSANIMVIRTSSTTARALVTVTTPGASTAVYTTQTDLTGLTLSGTNIIKITGTAAGASGGNGDISAKLGTITWIGAANN